MKSLASDVLNIEKGLLKDTLLAFPLMGGSLSLDECRLSQLSKDRGEGLWTLDLPCLDSLLTRGLETGRLQLEGPLSRAVSKRVRVPRLFSGLWLRIFDKAGCLMENVDADAILYLRQLLTFGKKIGRMCTPERTSKSVKEYHNVERKLRPPTLGWSYDELDPHRVSSSLHLCDCLDTDLPLYPSDGVGNDDDRSLLARCQQVADILAPALGFFEPVTSSEEREREGRGTGFKHGPGAVADRRGRGINKYQFLQWSAKLEEWFPYRDIGTVASDTETQLPNHEVASRLIAVPKTAKAPRLIAAESTEYQFCQQWTKQLLEERLESLFGESFICFKKQSLSQAMVLRASRTQHLATVDLSSASDRLTCYVVERVLRLNPSLLHILHATRTRYLVDTISREKEYVKLKKFASQGTAVTFPVQTFVFLCLALGSSIQGKVSWSKIRRLRHKVRVFGDDIILPTRAYASLVRVLTLLQLQVNEDKSFSVGKFRESCGMDAWNGYDVTPVKPQHVLNDGPQSRMAILDTANNLFAKGFWNASKVIESTLGSLLLRRLPIVGRDCGITGRLSFCGSRNEHLRTRWNSALHRTEYRAYRVRTRQTRIVFGERFSLLQFFTEAPSGQFDWQAGTTERTQVSDGLGWVPLYSSAKCARS